MTNGNLEKQKLGQMEIKENKNNENCPFGKIRIRWKVKLEPV